MLAIKVPTNDQSEEMNRSDKREVRNRSILPSPPPKPTRSKSLIILLLLVSTHIIQHAFIISLIAPDNQRVQ